MSKITVKEIRAVLECLPVDTTEAAIRADVPDGLNIEIRRLDHDL